MPWNDKEPHSRHKQQEPITGIPHIYSQVTAPEETSGQQSSTSSVFEALLEKNQSHGHSTCVAEITNLASRKQRETACCIWNGAKKVFAFLGNEKPRFRAGISIPRQDSTQHPTASVVQTREQGMIGRESFPVGFGKS
jgi:hypothetical protein